MSFESQIGRNEIIIDDRNATKFTTVDPSVHGRGLIPTPAGFSSPVVTEYSTDDVPMVPRNEWDDRIEEMERTRTRLSDIIQAAKVPVKNQNGTNYCVSENTELLTDQGWVPFSEYDRRSPIATINTATDRLEYQVPVVFHAYEHKGEMVCSTHRRIDFCVTPDHRMLVKKWVRDKKTRRFAKDWSFVLAKDLSGRAKIQTAPKPTIGTEIIKVRVPGERVYSGDTFVKLCAILVAEGGVIRGRSDVQVSWYREELCEEVSQVLRECGFHRVSGYDGRWIKHSKAFTDWMRENLYVANATEYRSHTKSIPQIIMTLSPRQQEIFLEYYGDKQWKHSPMFMSTSKTVADQIQIMLLRCGRRSSVRQMDSGRPNERTLFRTIEWQSDSLNLQKSNIEYDRYNGMVYCVTVPNSTMITRLNGTVLISGQCWINAPVWCVEVVRCLQGEPYVPLSPASCGSIIKRFRNVGGWGTEGLRFITENGVVPVEKWPANAINRRYDTEEAWREAKKYKILEWTKLPDRDLDVLMSFLFARIPVAVGYNWWSHEVTAVDPVKVRGGYGIRIGNSWGQGWSENGYGILTGRRVLPDDAVAPRSVIPTAK